jgi:hypothetical protein
MKTKARLDTNITKEQLSRIQNLEQSIRDRFEGVSRVRNESGDTAELLFIDRDISGLKLCIKWDSTGITCHCNPSYVRPFR